MRLFIAALLLAQSAGAATRYVATTGNDTTGDGSVGNPYATITKAHSVTVAGDLVSIAAGTYPEHIEVTRTGTNGSPVRYVGTGGTVNVRAFRLTVPWIQLEGLTFKGARNTSWGAHVAIPNGGSNCLIKQCHFGPGTYVKANDLVYNDAEDSISSATSNFVAAGFVTGQSIYLGASGIPGAYHANHEDHTLHSVRIRGRRGAAIWHRLLWEQSLRNRRHYHGDFRRGEREQPAGHGMHVRFGLGFGHGPPRERP
jgi:Protein of unknown function (DUF1565)